MWKMHQTKTVLMRDIISMENVRCSFSIKFKSKQKEFNTIVWSKSEFEIEFERN